jgi:hypothetical protein
VVYDIERKIWNVVFLEMPNLRASQVQLFERKRFLVLVQLAASGIPEIYTWQPGSDTEEWTTVQALLPRGGTNLEELFKIDPDLTWGGKGDLIFYVSKKWDRALLYDLSKRS